MRTVLFVVQDFEVGGTPAVLGRLIQGLDRAQFHPQLALMNARGGMLDALSADCEVFDLAKGTRRGFPGAVVRYMALEKRLAPDVVVSALPNANTMCCLARVGRRGAPPLIVTEHVAHLSYLGDPRQRLTPVAVRRLYRKAARIVAVSDGLRMELEMLYALAPERLFRIYNPIDIDDIRAKAREPVHSPRGPVLVFVGRLADQKAPADLLQAFGALSKDARGTLVFVGDGPLRAALEIEAERMGLAERVIFTGTDSNPYRWMARADVFVSPSIYEGFSLTIAEAMAVGTAVVATDCPHGPRELLQDGLCGVLVPPRQPRALADAIGALLADAPRRERLARAGQQRVREFDQPTVVASYQALFESVCR